jgi:hypothetical protein
LLGALAVAGLSAFSLVPSEKLRLKPSKPLFFYLVPLLRTQQLLAASRAVIEAGDWPQLRSILSRISGEPNSVRVRACVSAHERAFLACAVAICKLRVAFSPCRLLAVC